MTEKLPEVMERMILRGDILKICEIAQPLGATEEVLHGALRREGYACAITDVRDACSYLQGKGLVMVEQLQNDVLQISRAVVKITPQGIDLLEGTAAVEGIRL